MTYCNKENWNKYKACGDDKRMRPQKYFTSEMR